MINFELRKIIQLIPSRNVSIKVGLNENKEICCKKTYKNLTKEQYQVRKREIKCLKQLKNHPRVVQLLQFEESTEFYNDETVYEITILMEYLGEMTLAKKIKEAQSNPGIKSNNDWLRKEMYELISLFSFMQNKNICHRDIRPENIMLNESNMLKIIDFSEGKLTGKNRQQTFRGHIHYLSPEMRRKNLDNQLEINEFKSDVWSLGLVFLKVESLRNFDLVYDSNLQNTIDEMLLQVGDNWIREVLRHMLQENPENRKDFCQLLQMIEQWPYNNEVCTDCGENTANSINICQNCRNHRCDDHIITSMITEKMRKYLGDFNHSCLDYCLKCIRYLESQIY